MNNKQAISYDVDWTFTGLYCTLTDFGFSHKVALEICEYAFNS